MRSRVTSGGTAASHDVTPGRSSPPCARSVNRLVVARIGVAHDARPRVGGEHALEARGRRPRPVGDDDHARVDRVSDPHAAAVVDADPGRARGGVEKRVEDRPVGDRVRAVPHRLRLAVRRGDRPRVEVVPPDHDRRRRPHRSGRAR